MGIVGVGERIDVEVEDSALLWGIKVAWVPGGHPVLGEFGAQIQQNQSTSTAARPTPHYVAFLILRL